MSIAKDSPHLAGAVRRLIAPDAGARLDPPWTFARERGSDAELDFVRPPGEVRFNPRPARVALILLHEGRLADETAVGASFLSCIPNPDCSELEQHFGDMGTLGFTAALPPDSLLADQAQGRYPLVIASALWLDRARHFHRSVRAEEPAFKEEFLRTTDLYLEIAGRSSLQLYGFLKTWRDRLEDRSSLRHKKE